MTRRRVTRGLTVAAAGALVLTWIVVHRTSLPGYDSMWSLVWGHQLAHGRLPDLDVQSGAPTPHPLAIVVAAALTLLGGAAGTAVTALSVLALAALGWSAFRLGAALFSTAVGALFAALLVTRPQFVFETLQAIVDIPFLALLLVAARIEVQTARAGRPVLLLLAVAGLLRPEAWVLSAAYAVFLVAGGTRLRPGLVAIALAAPCLWAAFDLLATGDPLFSLHTTRDLAAFLGRPRGAVTAFTAVPDYLEVILGAHVLWVALVGALVVIARFPARAVGPIVALCLGIAAFVGLGLAGLPVLGRYLLIPVAALALLCAAGLAGWVSLARTDRVRRVWAAAAVVGLVVLAVGALDDRDRVARVLATDGERQAREVRLVESLRRPSTRRWIAACGRVQVDESHIVPLVAYYGGIDPSRVWFGARRGPPDAVVVIRSQGPADATLRSLPRVDDGTWTIVMACR